MLLVEKRSKLRLPHPPAPRQHELQGVNPVARAPSIACHPALSARASPRDMAPSLLMAGRINLKSSPSQQAEARKGATRCAPAA